jgi:hypothetical protein
VCMCLGGGGLFSDAIEWLASNAKMNAELERKRLWRNQGITRHFP